MFVINEGSEEYIIEGTVEELEEEVRRVGLVSNDDKDYNSLADFLEGNDMYITKAPTEPDRLSVKEIAERWA